MATAEPPKFRPASGSKVKPNADEVIDLALTSAIPSAAEGLFSATQTLGEDADERDQTVAGVMTAQDAARASSMASLVSTRSTVSTAKNAYPFKSARISPYPEKPSTAGTAAQVEGSRASLSSKEAWKDDRPQSRQKPKPSSLQSSVITVREALDSNRLQPGSQELLSPSSSSKLSILEQPQLKAGEHAYVPYQLARKMIATIVEDMLSMKHAHVDIVNQIESNYRLIEDETQNQFNVFVLNLRKQFKNKVVTFRRVVEIHRKDLDQKQTYWTDSMQSLTKANKKLLNDKKSLLTQNKLLYKRMKDEKEAAEAAYLAQLESARDSYTTLKHQLEATESEKARCLTDVEALTEQLAHHRTEKDALSQQATASREADAAHAAEALQALDAQVASLTEELRVRDAELSRLNGSLAACQGDLADSAAMLATAQAAAQELQSQFAEAVTEQALLKQAVKEAPTREVVVMDASDDERKQLAAEHEKLATERQQMAAEYRSLDEQRASFASEREAWLQEKTIMQQRSQEAAAVIAELNAKYNFSQQELGKYGALVKEHEQLRAAYALLLTAASAVDSAKADDKIKQSLESRAALEEDATEFERDIKQWEADFYTQNKRKPEESDRSDGMKERMVMLNETMSAIRNIETEVDVLEKLKKGEMPPQIQAANDSLKAPEPVAPRELEVKIVEVPVPDPEIIRKLEAAETTILALQGSLNEQQLKLSELKATSSNLESRLAEMKEENAKLTAERSFYQKANRDLEAELKIAKSTLMATQSPLTRPAPAATVAPAAPVISTAAARESVTAADATAAVEAATAGDTQQRSPAPTFAVVQLPPADRAAAGSAGEGLEGDAVVSEALYLQSKAAEAEEKVRSLEAQLTALEEELSSLRQASLTAVDEDRVERLEEDVSRLESELREEQSAHADTRSELQELAVEMERARQQLAAKQSEFDQKMAAAADIFKSQMDLKDKELKDNRGRVQELEQDMLKKMPIDSANEMKKALKKLQAVTKERDGAVQASAAQQAQLKDLQIQATAAAANLEKEKAGAQLLTAKLKEARDERDKQLQQLQDKYDKREKEQAAETKRKIQDLQAKVAALESRSSAAAARPTTAAARRGGAQAEGGNDKAMAALTEQLAEKRKESKELQNKLAAMEQELKKLKSNEADLKEKKKQEKLFKELEKRLEQEMKRSEKSGESLKQLQGEHDALQKTLAERESQIKKMEAEIAVLNVSAALAVELTAKVADLEATIKDLNEEKKKLTEMFNSERVLRKKYFNMVEDMKGKIRVYCRARPMSKGEKDKGSVSVLRSVDEYSVSVEGSRGLKEFQFDHVFMPENTQQDVFEDTFHLVQSAVDGYNVCIFAYGQTGSGKTFTMIGDREQKFPGIAPRAFQRIFEVIEENKDKYTFAVSSYMLELYNDKLLDLYAGDDALPDEKMEIKKDAKGLVFVRGSQIREASSSRQLYALFEAGSKNRHVAATNMNAESSRSHLIISVVIESTNKSNGQVTKGKLSLVDLAGSERVAKTGATADQLKEANSINKSLAALGDVISALSSEQSFIPYRNNKLTMLMQDSLGGNSKTLMFVNVSPADYNCDETVTSLTYASRVKLITNDAQKNTDNKEISRLKAIIAKLKQGEAVDVEEEEAAA